MKKFASILVCMCLLGFLVKNVDASFTLPHELPYVYNNVTYTDVIAVHTLAAQFYGGPLVDTYEYAYYNNPTGVNRYGFNWGISYGAFYPNVIDLLQMRCDENNSNCTSSYFNQQQVGSALDAPIRWTSEYVITTQPFMWYNSYSNLPGVGDVIQGTYFAANYPPPAPPFFRYPVDFTLDNSNGWNHKVQSFGSLNNNRNAPHAAEDWNKTGGDIGEQLFAIADGTITNPDDGNSTDGWGKTFLIQHNAPEGKHFLTGTGELLSTVYSFYAHMLKSGQDASYDINKNWHVPMVTSVTKGQPVAQVGNADGQWPSHLHFEILKDSSKYRNNPYAWTAMGYRIDPSELINNGLYSDQSTAFSIIVHPYECNDAFKLNGNTPTCENPSSTMGNWTRRGVDYGSYELGYSGVIYSKPAEDTGTVLWTPNLPRDGQYRIFVYVPDSADYATSENAQYTVSTNSTNYDPYSLNQSTNHSIWVNIGTYNLYKEGDSKVSLQGNTSETGKVIAADAIKFEYVRAIQ